MYKCLDCGTTHVEVVIYEDSYTTIQYGKNNSILYEKERLNECFMVEGRCLECSSKNVKFCK